MSEGEKEIVWLDCESTGLGRLQAVTEVAYAIEDAEPTELILPHIGWGMDPAAAEISQYWDRGLWQRERWASLTDVEALVEALRGRCVAGANPRCDVDWLQHNLNIPNGQEPWHYRLLDIESFAAHFLGWRTPRGLLATATAMRDLGFDVPLPDHTAAGDVTTARMIHWAITTHRTEVGPG